MEYIALAALPEAVVADSVDFVFGGTDQAEFQTCGRFKDLLPPHHRLGDFDFVGELVFEAVSQRLDLVV